MCASAVTLIIEKLKNDNVEMFGGGNKEKCVSITLL